jgi:pyruvate/2-oxoglutarate dehydrogenase complex dihydrolipoamide dehydrogenase (E3) component
MVVHGAGRVPDIEDLDLEAARIEYDHKKGIKINDTCRAFQILRYMLLGM